MRPPGCAVPPRRPRRRHLAGSRCASTTRSTCTVVVGLRRRLHGGERRRDLAEFGDASAPKGLLDDLRIDGGLRGLDRAIDHPGRRVVIRRHDAVRSDHVVRRVRLDPVAMRGHAARIEPDREGIGAARAARRSRSCRTRARGSGPPRAPRSDARVGSNPGSDARHVGQPAKKNLSTRTLPRYVASSGARRHAAAGRSRRGSRARADRSSRFPPPARTARDGYRSPRRQRGRTRQDGTVASGRSSGGGAERRAVDPEGGKSYEHRAPAGRRRLGRSVPRTSRTRPKTLRSRGLGIAPAPRRGDDAASDVGDVGRGDAELLEEPGGGADAPKWSMPTNAPGRPPPHASRTSRRLDDDARHAPAGGPRRATAAEAEPKAARDSASRRRARARRRASRSARRRRARPTTSEPVAIRTTSARAAGAGSRTT